MKNQTKPVLVVAFLLAFAALGAGQGTPPPDNTSIPPSTAAPLINKDVIGLVKAGLSTDIVLAKIKASISDFDTSLAALQELKLAGVTDAIILAMVQARVIAVSDSLKVEESKSREVIAAERIISALRRLDNAIAVGNENAESSFHPEKTMRRRGIHRDLLNNGIRLERLHRTS